jgi:hypothetical protein
MATVTIAVPTGKWDTIARIAALEGMNAIPPTGEWKPTYCTLSRDLAISGGKYTVDRLMMDGVRAIVVNPSSSGQPLAFPTIGVWLELENLWLGFGYPFGRGRTPWVNIYDNDALLGPGTAGQVHMRITDDLGLPAGTGPLIHVPVWIPGVRGSKIGGSYYEMTFYYDPPSGHVILSQLPILPDGVQLSWVKSLPQDVGSLAAFLELLARNPAIEPYSSRLIPISSVSFGWHLGVRRIDEYFPITVVLANNTNQAYTVYMEEASHYFCPFPYGPLYWSFSDVLSQTMIF